VGPEQFWWTTLNRRLVVLTLALVAAALLTSFVPSTSLAQGGANKAAAEALFRQGQALMKDKSYDGACKKFDASQKLDPAVGTLLYLGDCNEKLGRAASAWASFAEAVSLAESTGDKKRQEIAAVRSAALEPQVSKLTINVAGGDTEGLTIRRNGTDLPPATWGSPLPLDAGEHEISAAAPGRIAFSKTVAITDGGENIVVDVPLLENMAAAPVPGPVDITGPPEPEPDQAPVDEPSDGTAMLVAGIVIGGVGVVGLVLGTVFGISADGTNADSLERCRTPTLCSDEGLGLRDDAQTQATLSTVFFIAGGVLAAGGLTLVLLAPSGPAQPEVSLTTTFGPEQAGLTIGGTW
jgi:hypothetical protein